MNKQDKKLEELYNALPKEGRERVDNFIKALLLAQRQKEQEQKSKK